MREILEAITVILGLMFSPSDTGYLSAYDQVPTDATIAYHQELGNLPEDLSGYDVYLAVLECDNHGRTGTLVAEGLALKFIVFDCAGIEDGGYSWMVRHNIVAEIDYYARMLWPQLVSAEATLIYDE